MIYHNLRMAGVPRKLVNLIADMHKKTKTCYRVDGSKSKYIETIQGVPQGDPLSPIIFNLVINPILNELFWAHKGSGSWINNQRLRVSQRDKLDGCMFTSGVQIKHQDVLDEGISQIGNLQRKTSVRILGSSALDLANVAAGKFDGFWCKRLNLWDIAAGLILVREAGGICLNEKGNDFDAIEDDCLIASSAAISSELLKNL